MTAKFTLHRFPLLPVLLAYILGVLLQTFLLQFVSITPLWLLLFCCTILILLISRLRLFSKWLPALLLLVIVLLGSTLTATFDVRNDTKWFGHQHNHYEAFVIKIDENPKEKVRTVLLPSTVQFGLKDGLWHELKGKLQVYVYKNEALPHFKQGEQYIIPEALVPMTHNNNPGSFDFAKKQNREGLYYQCFLSHKQLMFSKSAKEPSWINKTRTHLLHQLDTFIKDPVTRSLTQATLLNEADNMDAQMQKDYSATGISHIIAISGMHVNLLFGLMVLPMFWIRDKRKFWIKYIVVLPFVWIYVALCNFPPSAVRAALGFSLITLTMLIKRPQNNIHLLSLNAFVLLLFNPMWLFHVGVQLSFLAVLSIFIFYPVIKKWYSSKYKILNLIWQTIAVSLAVQVLVFPLVIFYFHQFPIWFLVANVLAALFSVLQMGMAFCIMFFGVMKVNIVAIFIAFILETMTMNFNKIIAWLNAHSWDLSRSIPLDGMDYLLIMATIILLSIFWLRKQKIYLFLGLGFCLTFVVNLIFNEIIAVRQERIVVYAGTRQTGIDYIKGKTSWTYTDSIAENVEQYALKPAHLKFRINKVHQMQAQNAFWRMGEKQIAFINNGSSLPKAQVDVLILSKEADLQPETITEKLNKPFVVLDASWGRAASLRYATAIRKNGITVHNVQTDGAWWFYSK